MESKMNDRRTFAIAIVGNKIWCRRLFEDDRSYLCPQSFSGANVTKPKA
jgi:hypothetical protein